MSALWLKVRPWTAFIAASLLGLLAVMCLRKKPSALTPHLANELETAKAAAVTGKLQVAFGQAAALQHVEREHAEAIRALDVKQQAEAEALRKDPQALTSYLIRAAR